MAYLITERLIPVNNYSRPGIYNQRITGLVIHWTANTAAGADALHNNMYFANLSKQGSSGTYASAHYNVDDHTIVRNLPEHEMAYHVGATQYNQNTLKLLQTTYPNDCTIGIEWCVNSGNDFNETWNRVAWLAADICKRYGIDPMTHMIRHYDVTWKDCPHFFTPNVSNGEAGWAKFRAAVKALMNGASSAPAPVNSAPTAPTSSLLKVGSTGDAVKSLQTNLNKFGYNLAVDGDFGPATDTAVRAFQTKNGLTVDGIVGPATLAKISALLAPQVSPTPAVTTSNQTGVVSGTDAEGLHVRVTPNASAAARGSVHETDKVQITGHVTSEGHGWYQINYNGQNGYVWDQYIKIVTNTPAPVAPANPAPSPKKIFLPANNPIWTVYKIDHPAVKANPDNIAGELTPARYSGLTFNVIEDFGGYVFGILTQTYGHVKIWADPVQTGAKIFS